MTNTEQIRTKKISFILALSVIIFAAITTYFTLCHDINIMRITTPVILGLAMSIILCRKKHTQPRSILSGIVPSGMHVSKKLPGVIV